MGNPADEAAPEDADDDGEDGDDGEPDASAHDDNDEGTRADNADAEDGDDGEPDAEPPSKRTRSMMTRH